MATTLTWKDSTLGIEISATADHMIDAVRGIHFLKKLDAISRQPTFPTPGSCEYRDGQELVAICEMGKTERR